MTDEIPDCLGIVRYDVARDRSGSNAVRADDGHRAILRDDLCDIPKRNLAARSSDHQVLNVLDPVHRTRIARERHIHDVSVDGDVRNRLTNQVLAQLEPHLTSVQPKQGGLVRVDLDGHRRANLCDVAFEVCDALDVGDSIDDLLGRGRDVSVVRPCDIDLDAVIGRAGVEFGDADDSARLFELAPQPVVDVRRRILGEVDEEASLVQSSRRAPKCRVGRSDGGRVDVCCAAHTILDLDHFFESRLWGCSWRQRYFDLQ